MTTFYIGPAGEKMLSGKISQFIPLWQSSLLTKAVVRLLEHRDYREPFLLPWPWR